MILDAEKIISAVESSEDGKNLLFNQNAALNTLEIAFGMDSYLNIAKERIREATNLANDFSNKISQTVGRLAAFNPEFGSKLFSYMTGETIERKRNKVETADFFGEKVSREDYLIYQYNQRVLDAFLFHMYNELDSENKLDEDGKKWLKYYKKAFLAHHKMEQTSKLDIEDSNYITGIKEYYQLISEKIKFNPGLSKSQITTLLSDIEEEKDKKLKLIDNAIKLRNDQNALYEYTHSDDIAKNLLNRVSVGGLILQNNILKDCYKRNEILPYLTPKEKEELTKQIEANKHFIKAWGKTGFFDFGGEGKAEEIRGKQILGIATPEEIEYMEASSADRFWSDAKSFGLSIAEGIAKFGENMIDGIASVISGVGQSFNLDTSFIDLVAEQDLSELGYQVVADATGVIDKNTSLHYKTVDYTEMVVNSAVVVAVSVYAPAVAAPFILGGIGFLHGAGSSYEQALQSGKSGSEALLYAYGKGAIEAAGNALCASKFSSSIIKTQGLKSYVTKSLIPRAAYTVVAPVSSEGLSVVIDGDFNYKSVIKNEVESVATFAISEYINAKKAYNSKEAKINRIYNGDMKDISEEDLRKLLGDEEFLKFVLDDNIDFNDPKKVYEKTHELYGKKHKYFIDDVKSDNIKRSAARKEWKSLSKEDQIDILKFYYEIQNDPKMILNMTEDEIQGFSKIANMIENKNITFKTIKDNVLKTYRASKDKGGFLYNFIKKAKTPALKLPRDSMFEILINSVSDE